MHDGAVEQVRHGREVDVRVRPHGHLLDIGRPHMIEERERADHLLADGRQHAADREAAEIARASLDLEVDLWRHVVQSNTVSRADHTDVTDTLETAARSVREGEWLAADVALVRAWRTAPSARVARALALVEAQCPPPPPIAGSTVGDRDARWHELVATRDDAVLASLLADAWPAFPRQAKVRVAALAAWPPSPKISNALVALLSRGQYRSRAGRVVARKMLVLLVDARDPAVTEYLVRLEAEPGDAAAQERESMVAILRRVRPAEPVWAPREAAALDAIETALAPKSDRDGYAQLLADVYATPHDDAPRAVLADYLIERGDPRGELIALQLQPRRDAARVRALIRRGGRAWFDGIDADGASEIAIDRGFPVAATTLGQRFTAPAWATVEHVSIPNREVAFRGSPLLRALRSLYGVHAADLSAIEPACELETLWVRDATTTNLDVPSALAPRRFGLVHTGALLELEIVDALHAAPVGRRVTSLQLATDAMQLRLWHRLERPWVDEMIFDRRRHPYRRIEASGWLGRIMRGRLLELEWRGTNYSEMSEILPVLREMTPLDVATVEVRGWPRAQSVERAREILEKIFSTWPEVRQLHLFE